MLVAAAPVAWVAAEVPGRAQAVRPVVSELVAVLAAELDLSVLVVVPVLAVWAAVPWVEPGRVLRAPAALPVLVAWAQVLVAVGKAATTRSTSVRAGSKSTTTSG